MIEIVDSGVVYRNPHPHLRALHAWHPSLVQLGARQWLATFDLAEAVESHGYATYLSRSDDDGASWSAPVRVIDPAAHAGSCSLRLGKVGDGTLTLAGALHSPREHDQGILNPETFGYTPMTLVLMTSTDDGAAWTAPRALDHPFLEAPLETCHSVVELDDGRWVLPTSTWRTWEGRDPHGMKAVLLESTDRGRTWPKGIVVADSWASTMTHFEQSLAQRSDGSLISVSWEYGVDSGITAPTPFALSSDGRTFDHRGRTGLLAQTAKLCVLPDDSLLVLWRGRDEPGLWASRAHLDGRDWITDESVQVWAGALQQAEATSAADELSDLRFGYPSLVVRPDGDVEAVFWCRENEQNIIRRVRIRVDNTEGNT